MPCQSPQLHVLNEYQVLGSQPLLQKAAVWSQGSRPPGGLRNDLERPKCLREELQSQLALQITCKKWPVLPRSSMAALQTPALLVPDVGTPPVGDGCYFHLSATLFRYFWMGFVQRDHFIIGTRLSRSCVKDISKVTLHFLPSSKVAVGGLFCGYDSAWDLDLVSTSPSPCGVCGTQPRWGFLICLAGEWLTGVGRALLHALHTADRRNNSVNYIK